MKLAQTKLIGSYNKKTAKPKDLYSSRPAAGFPAPGDDFVERSLDLNDLLIKNPNSTFFVKVEGDSMEDAKIFSGDILVVDRGIQAKHGLIVVAAIYGEMVVKRLRLIKGDMYLVSEAPGYESIKVTSNDDCFVWGVVVGTARVL